MGEKKLTEEEQRLLLECLMIISRFFDRFEYFCQQKPSVGDWFRKEKTASEFKTKVKELNRVFRILDEEMFN